MVLVPSLRWYGRVYIYAPFEAHLALLWSNLCLKLRLMYILLAIYNKLYSDR